MFLHFQEEIRTAPPFPPPLPVDNFFILISQKMLLNIKDVEFDFRMGCILVLFPFLWIIKPAIYKFWIFEFFIFKISDIGLFWSKITIFIIEISLKLHFRMGCILVLFPFLWIIKLAIYKFWIFLFSKLVIFAYFDPK